MNVQLRRYAWSFVVALVVTLLVGGIASVPRYSPAGVLFGPGMLVAAIVFPEGINSDWAKTYLVSATLMNAFLLAWPGVWLWTWIGCLRRRG